MTEAIPGIPAWSYVAADTDSPVLETTVGGILRAAAAQYPDRLPWSREPPMPLRGGAGPTRSS